MKKCVTCERELDLSEFPSNKAKPDGHAYSCFECTRAYRKKWYEQNRQGHLATVKEHKKRKREYVLEVKRGTCVDCGASYPGEPWLMEFDHRDSEKKVADIGKVSMGMSWTALKEEIDKCDLLCLICHRRRTALRGKWKENRYASLA